MKIQNVTDASFRKYGKVLEGYDFSALLKEMKHTLTNMGLLRREYHARSYDV